MTEPQPTPPAAPDEAEPKLERFRRRRSGVRGHGGGVARGRLEALLDPESLVELDLFASEAVVAGWGAVDGRDVVVYALEPGAAWGEAAGRKIAKAQALALRSRVPIIGIEDVLRPAAEDDLAAAAARADVLARQARSSGLVPQLTVAAGGRHRAGPGAAGPPGVGLAALGDFLFVVAGAADDRAADFPAAGEEACWTAVRDLLAHLPSSGDERPPARLAVEEPDPLDLVPRPGADMRAVAAGLLDGGRLLEARPGLAPNLLTGFGRLGGCPVGVVANQPAALDGALDADAAAKAARFVRCCDAFNVPVVSLVDTPGLAPGAAEDAAAGLVAAYARARVPKLAVVVGRASGSDYWLMSPHELGGDLCLAWPSARIGVAEPYAAAERGAVDRVVEPRETRRELIHGLRLCLHRPIEPAGRGGGTTPR